jgi:hypothetical protein
MRTCCDRLEKGSRPSVPTIDHVQDAISEETGQVSVNAIYLGGTKRKVNVNDLNHVCRVSAGLASGSGPEQKL